MMFRNWILLAVTLTLMVSAQILWKIGLTRIGIIDIGGKPLWPQILSLLMSWRIILGVVIFAGTTLLWMDLLSKMQLSLLYPFMSLSYVLAFFAGWLWLGEEPSLERFIGILVICSGIFLVARTAG